MYIDINQFTSDELFELAKKRKQEEEASEARRVALGELRQRRDELIAEHARTLETLDGQIRELHNRRGQLVIRHKTAVDELDGQIAELRREEKAVAEQPSAPEGRVGGETAPGEKPRAAAGSRASGGADLATALAAIMKGRLDISESLLREHLRNRGIDISNFSRQLEQLVREKKLLKKGSGNYALPRK